jgi:multiple sugar transport system ATP-binding protein
MAIYQRPANQFVASFVGSPAMNFIRGEIANGAFQFADSAVNGNGVTARTISLGSTLPAGPAVLGVRPEDLLPSDDGCRLGPVTLDVIEHMGHETMAHFSMADGAHVARLPANAGVQPGDRLALAIRPGAFHLFSAADGRRLN